MGINIKKLVYDALESKGPKTYLAIDMLERAVRSLECKEGNILKPVQRALPELAPYLLYDSGNVAGYTISIFRRVNISIETINALITLLDKSKSAFIISALGLSDSGIWPDSVERILAKALNDVETVESAAYALYCNYDAIKDIKTVELLKDCVLFSNPSASRSAFNALACTTKGQDPLNQQAKNCIIKILSKAEVDELKIYEKVLNMHKANAHEWL